MFGFGIRVAYNDCIYAIGTVRNIMQDTFRYFIRKNFPEIGSELSNKDIDEIGVEFHKHLDSKLNDEQKERILPKNAMDVIMKSEHPFWQHYVSGMCLVKLIKF